MSDLIVKIKQTKLIMNAFPGWTKDPEWISKFKKKAKGISVLFLRYADDPKALTLNPVGDFYEADGSDYGSSISISIDNLKDGKFIAEIDKEKMQAHVIIGGEFVIDSQSLDKEGLKALKAAKYLLASGFSFSNAKGGDTDVQGKFTDSWDSVVPIECAVVEGKK
jgi:hypothetical protein